MSSNLVVIMKGRAKQAGLVLGRVASSIESAAFGPGLDALIVLLVDEGGIADGIDELEMALLDPNLAAVVIVAGHLVNQLARTGGR